MTISNWTHLDRHTVHVAMSGRISRDDYRAVDTLGNVAQETPVRRLVIDKLQVERDRHEPSAGSLAEDAAEKMRGGGIDRIAFLEAHPNALADAFKQAFQRRGGEVKTFEELKTAQGWLEVFHSGAAPDESAVARGASQTGLSAGSCPD